MQNTDGSQNTPSAEAFQPVLSHHQLARNRILSNIRAGLREQGPELQRIAASASHIPPPSVHPPVDDLVQQFISELTKLEGKAYHCADDQAALTIIRQILEANQSQSVITWKLDLISLPGLAALLSDMGITQADSQVAHTGNERAARLQTLEPVPVCISGAEYAIAESGSIVVISDRDKGRLASLLAPIHIAIVPVALIHRGLGDALAAIRQQYGPELFANHSNLTIITGPSRTADIELTLTLGVHGPREIHVILLESQVAKPPDSKRRRASRGRRVPTGGV